MNNLLFVIVTAVVQWTVVADGPTTYAVVKDYGGAPHWSRQPTESGQEATQLRICNQVPTEEAAREIAALLNQYGR